MTKTLPLILLPFALSPWCSAATLAKYLIGTNSAAAADVAGSINAPDISFTGTSEWRTSFGSPGGTPAGPNLSTSSSSYWRLFKTEATPTTPTAATASVLTTLSATGGNFTPTLLTFDLANAIHNAAASSVTTEFTVFINDVALNSSLITPGSTLFNDVNNKYKVQTFTADLSGLGDLSSMKLEIALADDADSPVIGNFIQGIHIEGVPEPSHSLLLLGSVAAFALRRRRN